MKNLFEKQYTQTEIKNYLKSKITDSWYKNAKIDYDVNGKFIDIEFNNENLTIIHEEEGQKFKTLVAYYKEYELEQIYDIWMEEDWEAVA